MSPLHEKNTLLGDGTLVLVRGDKHSVCNMAVGDGHHPPELELNHIKRIHFQYNECYEGQLGNRLGEYYIRMLFANAARIPFGMACDEQPEATTKTIIDYWHTDAPEESVLKHLLYRQRQKPSFHKGNNTPIARESTSESGHVLGPQPFDLESGKPWTVHHVCDHCRHNGWSCKSGLQVIFPIIKEDMHHLAYETPTGKRLQADADDAVIHLRLGDALRGKKDEGIGLLPHMAYARILQKVNAEMENVTTVASSSRAYGKLQSIGIVTQPFDSAQARSVDKDAVLIEKAKAITHDFVDYLQKRFPSARIRIHNDSNETPLTSMIRLIQAKNVAVCGASTFCTMPVLSTHGEGYLFRAPKHSPWAHLVTKQHPDRLHSFAAPRLANHVITKMTSQEIVHWLRNQHSEVGLLVISEPPLIRNDALLVASQ